MNISPVLQNACLTMLSEIAEMHPELRDLQGCAMAEMEKGSDRNLASVMDELVILSARGYCIMERFQKTAAVEMESANLADTIAAMNAFTAAFSEGKFGDFENLSPELIEALQQNLKRKEELEGVMDLKFGKGALMRMITEDGLLPDFLEGMNKALYPDQTPDREGIEDFAKNIVEDALSKVQQDLK